MGALAKSPISTQCAIAYHYKFRLQYTVITLCFRTLKTKQYLAAPNLRGAKYSIYPGCAKAKTLVSKLSHSRDRWNILRL